MTSIFDTVDNEGFTWLSLSPQSHKSKATAGWFFLVRWKDGQEDVVRLRDIKESYPIEIARYAKSVNIDTHPAFTWWINIIL